MIKSLIRRHRLLLLPSSVIIGVMALAWAPLAAQTFTPPPLAPVVITEATVVGRGVQVRWLAAQSTHSVARYSIERETSQDQFVPVAQVDKDILAYFDGEGKSGDRYRVIAEDAQQPAVRSRAGEATTAVSARPGEVVRTVSSELTNTSAIFSADTLGRLIKEVDTAIAQGEEGTFEARLFALYSYQTQTLSRITQLPIAEKRDFSRVCRDNLGILEADFHLLPERYRMDGNLVTAACEAIQEAAGEADS